MTTTNQNNKFEHLPLSWEIVYTYKVALNIVFYQPPVNIGHLVQQQPKQLHMPLFTKLTKIQINPNNVLIAYITNNCLPCHCLQITYNSNT